MASLVLKMSASLDGYVAPIDGSTDWVAAGRSDDGASWTVETLSNAGAHLMGATTYPSERSRLSRAMAAARSPVAIVVSPQSAHASESENTTLGISFIGLANGPEAPGQ